MKKFISKVQSLSQKAAEIKAAMQQVPPKVAEFREAVASTAGQLQQLKSEIQYSVADLKADQEDHLSEALQEIHNSADAFEKAGFVLDGVDLEISPVQRVLVHLLRTEDVHDSVLRSLVQANQHRRTTKAILSSLLQAKQMAETVEVGNLIYNEVIIGIGPIPSVRLCWRPEEIESASIAAQPVASTPSAAAASVAAPQSAFGSSSFFERREAPTAVPVPQPIVPTPSMVAPVAQATSVPTPQPVATSVEKVDPLARFKKMPILNR